MIRGLKVNLLGFPSITALKILKRVDAVKTEEMNIKQQFPKVFSGLGDFGEHYHIQLKLLSIHPQKHCNTSEKEGASRTGQNGKNGSDQ